MIKFFLKSALLLLILAMVFTIFANVLVVAKTSSRVYQSLHDIPNKEVALVLGTSKKTVSGESNSFFQYRMDAAAALYKFNKVEKLLLSGSSTQFYNEPEDMKKALMKMGVPDSAIIIDTEGSRTFDSILRCKEVFHMKDVIIITQEFHAYRALFISDYLKLSSLAYCAEEVPVYSSTRVNIREFFARPKALIDVYTPRNLLVEN